MIARPPSAFRARKREREAICSAGEVISLAARVTNCTTWGKITSRRHPPPGTFEEWARRLNTSVSAVRRMWERGIL